MDGLLYPWLWLLQGEDKEKVKKREAAEREEKSRKVCVDQ